MRFEDVYRYFIFGAAKNNVEEMEKFIKDVGKIKTADQFGRPSPKEFTQVMDYWVDNNTFIVIDGPSNSGKSTLGKKLAVRYNAVLLDIDIIAMKRSYEFLRENIANFHGSSFSAQDIQVIEDDSSKYILNNLDDIVSAAKAKGKPVILVGRFTGLLMRAMIAGTVGMQFQNAISIFCFEKDISKFRKAIKKRNSEYGFSEEATRETLNQYYETIQVLQRYGEDMRIGFDHCIMVDFKRIDAFKEVDEE